MRVVITGATGNLGTSLVDLLSRDPQVESIVGIARRLPAWDPPRTTWVAADIRTARLDQLFAGADAVVNLAWAFQPTHDPVATWANNVRGSERVFDAAAGSGAGVLMHASSVGAYRDHQGQEPVDERWPTDALPTAAYGREKSYLERVLDQVSCHHPLLRVVRMRPCFLFRRGSASEQRRIFAGPLLPTSALRVRLPVVPLPADLRFQAMHTADAAEGFRMALHRPVHGAFNLATEDPLGPAELASLLGGRAVPVPNQVVRAGLAAAWHARLLPASPQLFDLFAGLPLLDPTRARRELGWIPRRSGLEAVAELLEGLRQGGRFPTPPLAGDRPGRWDEIVSGVGQFGRGPAHPGPQSTGRG
jgi:UDP-glucose 4-epimerase